MKCNNLSDEHMSDPLYHMPEAVTHLIVFHSEIVSLLALLVGDLHEETTHECLPDVHIELALIRHGHQVYVEALHASLQLGAHIVCLSQCPCRQIVRPRPGLVVLICSIQLARFPLYQCERHTLDVIVVHVQQSEVVTVRDGKQGFRGIGLSALIVRSYPHIRY